MHVYVRNDESAPIHVTVFGTENPPSYEIPAEWYLHINGATGASNLVEEIPEEG